MTESDHDQSAPSASQRPTLEVVDGEALQFTSAPPVGSNRPSALLDRETVPGSPRGSWAPIVPSRALPLEFELRLLIGVLRALTPIHTNLLAPPHTRVHGHICRANFLVDPDGSVRLRSGHAAVAAPGTVQAPEAIGGAVVDQQADIYSVGLLTMDAVERATVEDPGVRERVRAVAARAVRLDPRARWKSASELAQELEKAAGEGLPTRNALAAYLQNRSSVVPGQRPSVTSVPDSEVELLDPAPDDCNLVAPEPASAISGERLAHCPDREFALPERQPARPSDADELGRAQVSFDPHRLATSLTPEETPRKHPIRWLWATLSLALVGSASWTLTRMALEPDTPLATETSTDPTEGELVAPPEIDEALPPAGSSTTQEMAGRATRPPERPSPSVTGVLPAAPAPVLSGSSGRLPLKPKEKPQRNTTYDPEGI